MLAGSTPDLMGILIMPEETKEEKVIAHLRDGWAEVLVQPLSKNGVLTSLTQALRRSFRMREAIRMGTLSPLSQINEDFLLNLDLNNLLNQIVHTAMHEAACDRVSLMLIEDRKMRIRAAVGLPEDMINNWVGDLGEGIAGYAAITGEAVIINKGEEDPRFMHLLRDTNIRSAVSLPLKVKGKVIGVLNITNFSRHDHFQRSEVQFLSLLANVAAVAIQNANLYNSLQTSYLHTIVSLANALEARDVYLSGHSTHVLNFSVKIARKMGLPDEEIEAIRNASILHDIGKIGVRDAILLKPGCLDDSEWAILRTHPEMGSKIIAPVRHLALCVPLILHHHERWDGTGYPSGLAGTEIPLGARIIAVADTYDAMTSDRPYRGSFTNEQALIEIKCMAGSQFDPEVTSAFLAVMSERPSDAAS